MESNSTTGTVLLARRALTIDDPDAGDELGARQPPSCHSSTGVMRSAFSRPPIRSTVASSTTTIWGCSDCLRPVRCLPWRSSADWRENDGGLEAEARLADAERRGQVRRETLVRIVEAQEEERGRIARELHDEFGQHLASVLLGLRLVEQAGIADEARDAMSELVQTINAAISQLRTLAIELRPTALDDLGLVAALERLTESYYAEPGGSSTWPSTRSRTGSFPLVETTVYRVVQESLTNVAKHAGAESVIVRGELRASELVVTVSDDGKGSTRSNPEPGR